MRLRLLPIAPLKFGWMAEAFPKLSMSEAEAGHAIKELEEKAKQLPSHNSN